MYTHNIHFLASCSNNVESLVLPKGFDLSKKKSVSGVLDEVDIFSVHVADSSLIDLQGYPKNIEKDKITLGWVDFNSIDPVERKRLVEEVENVNMSINDPELARLVSILKGSNSIRFSAHYTDRPTVKSTYKFYHDKFFLDFQNMELFVFDFIEGS